jgi:hypothetical protein
VFWSGDVGPPTLIYYLAGGGAFSVATWRTCDVIARRLTERDFLALRRDAWRETRDPTVLTHAQQVLRRGGADARINGKTRRPTWRVAAPCARGARGTRTG